VNAVTWSGLFVLAAGVIGCRSVAPTPKTTDPEIMKLARTAAQTHRHVSPARAAPLYRAALARAYALGDRAAAGRLAYNLAVCLAESGDLETALRLVREAQMDLRRSGASVAEATMLEAVLCFDAGDRAAGEAVARAMTAAQAEKRGDLIVQACALRAEMALENGDANIAEAELRKARRYLSSTLPPSSAARFHAACGRLAGQRGDHRAAKNAFHSEAKAWGHAGLASRVSDALDRAALAAIQAEDWTGASEAWLDAARSRAAQGDIDGAAARLKRLADLPEGPPDRAIQSAADRLARELEQRRHAQAPSSIPAATP